ncbi:MAG TPA: DUF885 domain-containing protein [Myxococcaceae bacterium]|jgi:hypothetical protein|nr:DUF885 domain-containing protein [Myxococcaceae bacterium]
MRRPPLLPTLLLAAACATTRGMSPEAAHAAFTKLVDDAFSEEFAFNPVNATNAGIHSYDGQLEPWTDVRIRAHVVALEGLLDRTTALWTERTALGTDDLIDLEALDGHLRVELLDWNLLHFTARNPMTYAGRAGNAIDPLLKRDFAPARERLKSVISRLEKVPALYTAGKGNVTSPPREWTELAIGQAKGTEGYLRDTLAAWAKDAAGDDAVLWADFQRANITATAATQDFLHWLTKTVLPQSTGTWAIGARAYVTLLKHAEFISTPLDELLAQGEAQLQKDRQAFIATAREIDPTRSPEEVFASLAEDHPTAADLLPYARRTLEQVRQFAVRKELVTFPSEARPKVEDTPVFMRIGNYASMDTPGAYETRATEAFYYITPPEQSWDRKHIEEHLREFNSSMLPIIHVHEAYPGHFVQFLWAPRFPTKVRKLLPNNSNVEGWAHYSEEMVIEEGFADDNPKLKLAQLEEALVRDCRYVVGIGLHTTTLTVEQGADRFVRDCYQNASVAYDEARRGTYDPTYLYYTSGKLMILALRQDYLSQKGGTLRQFHDAFLSVGPLPIPLVRKLLLPEH